MLDTRLQMVYDLMPDGIVCDIGTDHCKLCVHAVLNKKAPYAYGTDLRDGPLEAAKRLVDRHGLERYITLIKSDGLCDIPNRLFNEINCFVIAGMGGELIASILLDKNVRQPLVLQPMTGGDELCEFLCRNGYDIKKHCFCMDGERVYEAMLVQYDGIKRPAGYFNGVIKNNAFYRHLEIEIERMEFVLDCLNSSTKSDKSRIQPTMAKLKLYKNELEKSK